MMDEQVQKLKNYMDESGFTVAVLNIRMDAEKVFDEILKES